MVYMNSLLLYEIFISIYVSFQVQAVAAFVTILRFRIWIKIIKPYAVGPYSWLLLVFCDINSYITQYLMIALYANVKKLVKK